MLVTAVKSRTAAALLATVICIAALAGCGRDDKKDAATTSTRPAASAAAVKPAVEKNVTSTKPKRSGGAYSADCVGAICP